MQLTVHRSMQIKVEAGDKAVVGVILSERGFLKREEIVISDTQYSLPYQNCIEDLQLVP